MTPPDIMSRKPIANLRTLKEQIIKGLKTIRMSAMENPIKMLKLFNDVVGLCGALRNLRKPIYLDWFI